jgi:hypothetical protein
MRVMPFLGAALASAALCSPSLVAQRGARPAGAKVKVEIVQTVGCVERRAGDPPLWWLTRAQAPSVTRDGVFNRAQVDEAKKTSTVGTLAFHLIGVADFLDVEGLLRSGNRAQFTSADQVNATGELREGRTVLVKGLLIDAGGESRINLIAVVGIADTCR